MNGKLRINFREMASENNCKFVKITNKPLEMFPSVT